LDGCDSTHRFCRGDDRSRMTVKIPTPVLIQRYVADDHLTEGESIGLIRRAFSPRSKDATDTAPVLDFLNGAQSNPAGQLVFDPVKSGADPVGFLQDTAYADFCAAPRNLGGNAGSGQSFKSVGLVRGTPELIIHGTSKKAYTLSFILAAEKLDVAIPARTSPRRAASLIAAAINAKSDAIAASDSGAAFGAWTDSALGAVAAVARGSSVFITPDIHD